MNPNDVYYRATEMILSLPVSPEWDDPEHNRVVAKGFGMEVFMNVTNIRPVLLVDAADFHPESGWGSVGTKGMIAFAQKITNELMPGFAMHHSKAFGCFIYNTNKLSKKDFTGLTKISNRSIEKVGKLLGYPCADAEESSVGVDIWTTDDEGDEIEVSAQMCDSTRQVMKHMKKFIKLAENLEKAIKKHSLPMERVEIRIGKRIGND